MQVSKQTVVRTVVCAIALVNTVACMCGATTALNITDAQIAAVYDGVSVLVAIATTAWAWWKNNSFTAPAITADNVLQLMQQGVALVEAATEVADEEAADEQ